MVCEARYSTLWRSPGGPLAESISEFAVKKVRPSSFQINSVMSYFKFCEFSFCEGTTFRLEYVCGIRDIFLWQVYHCVCSFDSCYPWLDNFLLLCFYFLLVFDPISSLLFSVHLRFFLDWGFLLTNSVFSCWRLEWNETFLFILKFRRLVISFINLSSFQRNRSKFCFSLCNVVFFFQIPLNIL